MTARPAPSPAPMRDETLVVAGDLSGRLEEREHFDHWKVSCLTLNISAPRRRAVRRCLSADPGAQQASPTARLATGLAR